MLENGSNISDKERAQLQSNISKDEHNAGFAFVIFRNKKIVEQLCEANIFEHASLHSYKAEN